MNNKKVRFEVSGLDKDLLLKIKEESKKEKMTASKLVIEILKLYFEN